MDKIDLTERFFNQIKIKLQNKEVIVIKLKGKTRQGMSTIGMNIHKWGKR